MNMDLPFDDAGDDLDELVTRMDGVLDEAFLRDVRNAIDLIDVREVDVAEPLAG